MATFIQNQDLIGFHTSPKEISTENDSPCSKKKYVKITKQVKESFLDFIIHENLSIKEASEKLRINYSSAKAILSQHKKTTLLQKRKFKPKMKGLQCSYRSVSSSQPSTGITLKTLIGGHQISQTMMIPKTKLIIKMNLVIQ